eukprot:Skav225104  [mRNA]  locus=scaffold3924:45364:52018:- [translate_table: standard]
MLMVVRYSLGVDHDFERGSQWWFAVHVCDRGEGPPAAASSLGRHVCVGRDHAPLAEESRAPVGQPLMHRSALPQCTGEAKYTDDMPKLPGTLHAVMILSERAHAKILSIDTSAALAFPKVVQGAYALML